MKQKLVVFGLDGVSYAFLRGLMGEGKMPHLSTLLADGCMGSSESTKLPLTAIAWSTIYTGKNPGKTGICGFVRQQENSYLWEHVSPAERRSLDFWEIMSREGLRSIIVGNIFTQPRRDFNGIFIGGEFCGDIENSIYPASMKGLVLNQFAYQPVCEYKSLDEIDAFMANKFRLARHLLKTEHWDLAFLSFMEMDDMHYLFHWSKYAWLEHAYLKFDELLGEFVDDVGEDRNYFFLSDHGNRKYTRAFHVNAWLHVNGFLKLQPPRQIRKHKQREMLDGARCIFRGGDNWWDKLWYTSLFVGASLVKESPKLSGGIRRLMPFLELPSQARPRNHASGDGVMAYDPEVYFDFSSSQAYAFPNHGGNFAGICINRRDLYPKGTVDAVDYEAVRGKIRTELEATTDESGHKLVKEVWCREELFDGPYAGDLPDLVFEVEDNHFTYIAEDDISARVCFGFRNCQHELLGFFAGAGPIFRSNHELSSSIINIAPTLLHIMGVAVPVDFDGHVEKEIFTDTFNLTHPVQIKECTSDITYGDVQGLSEDEQKLLDERLRAMGYL